MVVPNGNCRYRSKSGRVVNEKYILIGNYYVVGKFILCYHFGYKLRVNLVLRFGCCPSKYLIQPTVHINLRGDSFEFCL